jgi:hypothetical protein
LRCPDAGLSWQALRERLGPESEVEFPSPAFGQVESRPDGVLQIGLRDGNLQAYRFNRSPVPGGILGFAGIVFGIHGIRFFYGLFSVVCLEKRLRNRFVSSMG